MGFRIHWYFEIHHLYGFGFELLELKHDVDIIQNPMLNYTIFIIRLPEWKVEMRWLPALLLLTGFSL